MATSTRAIQAHHRASHAHAAEQPPISAAAIRRAGVILATGTLTWVAGTVAVGAAPTTTAGITVGDLTGLAFQLGLFALLTVQLRTRAAGPSRTARRLLLGELIVLGLATVWSVIHGLLPPLRDDVWLAVLDACWPLSMLGMFVISVAIARAGAWRGVLRIWPLVAETWAFITIPADVAFGEAVGTAVGATHLVVGYATLGVLLAFRPHLARSGDEVLTA